MRNAVNESNPLVGSSNINTSGLVNNSVAMEVRLRSPPEIPFMVTPPINVC